MRLDQLKFKDRGELLFAAEVLSLKPDKEIPKQKRFAALLLSCGKEFEPNANWFKIVEQDIDKMDRQPDTWLVSIGYTDIGTPVIIIPYCPLRDFNGEEVRSDCLILESRTLHLRNVAKKFYGESI